MGSEMCIRDRSSTDTGYRTILSGRNNFDFNHTSSLFDYSSSEGFKVQLLVGNSCTVWRFDIVFQRNATMVYSSSDCGFASL